MKFGDRCHTIWTIRLGWKFFEKPVGGGFTYTHLATAKKTPITFGRLGHFSWDPFFWGIKLDANVEYFFWDFSFFVHEVWVGNSSADPCLVINLPFPIIHGLKILFSRHTDA